MYGKFFIHKYDLKATSGPKISCWKKFVHFLCRLGSGSGSGPSQFEKSDSDPDPDKSRPDSQHGLQQHYSPFPNVCLGLLQFAQSNKKIRT
jgi:hypothetical protein